MWLRQIYNTHPTTGNGNIPPIHGDDWEMVYCSLTHITIIVIIIPIILMIISYHEL